MLATPVRVSDNDSVNPVELTVDNVGASSVSIEAQWLPSEWQYRNREKSNLPVYAVFSRRQTWRLVWTLIRATLPRWP
jgi:hypothetical protein